jgi:hypothetical protein
MIDWNSLSAEQQDRIVGDGLALMLSLTEIVGPDEGLAMWDDMSMRLGDDAKAAIFFAMLSGNGLGTVRIHHYPPNYKVHVIKLIRTYTGTGLKEAKDISEEVIPTFRVPARKIHECRAELKELGCSVA